MSTSGSVHSPIVGLAPRTRTASPRAQVLRELLATTGSSPGRGRRPDAQQQEQVQAQHAGTSATSSSRPRERVARITLHNALSGDPLPVEVVCRTVNEDTAKPEQEMVSVKELKRGIAQAVKARKWAEMHADARQLAAAGARSAASSSRVPLSGQEEEDDQHSGAGHKLHRHAAGTSKKEHGATALEDVAHDVVVPLEFEALRKAKELHPPPPDSDAAEYDVRVEGELHALFIWADMHELIGSWPIFSRPGEFAPNNPRNYVTVQYGCGNSSGGRGSGSSTRSSSLSFQPAPAPAFGSFGPQYRGRERTGRPREDVAQQYVDLMRLRFWVSAGVRLRQRPDEINQPIGDPEEVAAFEGASREKKLAMLYKLVMEILDLAEKAEGLCRTGDDDASAEGAAATMAQQKGAEASCPRSWITDRGGTQEIQTTSNRRPRGRGREVQMEVVSADNWRNSLAFKMARRLNTTAPHPRPLEDKALRQKVAEKLEKMSKPEGDRRLRCALWRTYWQQAPDRRACVCGARANAQHAINEKASSPSSTLRNAPAAPTKAEQTEERQGRDVQSQSQSQSSRGKGSPAPPIPPPKGAAKGSKTTQGTGNHTSKVSHLREDVDDDECKSTIQTLPCICRCSFEHFYDINVNPVLSSGPGAVTRPVLPAPWVPWQLCEVLRMPLPEDAGAGAVSGVEDLQTGHEGEQASAEALPADVPMSSLAGGPSLPGLRRSSSSDSLDDLDDSGEPLDLVPVDESLEKFLPLADLSTKKFRYLVKPHLFQAFKRRDELQKALTTLRLHPIIRRRQEGTAAYDAMMATYGPLATWDLSGVTDLSYLFGSWPTFAEDVSGWNVSNVRNMQGIFEGCRRFDSELNDWDVGKCEDFRSAFERCETFDRTLVDWRVRESGKSFSRMFSDCSRFNQDLLAWRLGLETAEGNENSTASCSGRGSPKSKSSQELSSRQLLLEDMFCRCVWMEKPPVNWPYFRKIVERWMEAAGPDGASVMLANIMVGSFRPIKVKKLIALNRGEPLEVLLGASTSSDSESEDDDDSQCQSGRVENHMQNEGTQPMNKFMRVVVV